MLLCGCMDAQQAPREEKVTVGTHKAAENTEKQQGGDSAPEEAFNIPKTAAYVTNNMSEEQKRQCEQAKGESDPPPLCHTKSSLKGCQSAKDVV